MHICPGGAFSGDDGVKLLYDSVAALRTATRIELVCHQHPSAEKGAAENDAVVRVDHCLAAFGPSVYVGLLSLLESGPTEATTDGATAKAGARVSLRLDACRDCPIGAVQPSIARTIADANALVEAAGHQRPFATIEQMAAPASQRTVIDAKPQMSRRQLFTALTGGSKRLLTGSLLPETPPKGTKVAPAERQRLIAALKLASTNGGNAPAELPFANLVAGDNCSACGVCARACPTGALQFVADRNDRYRLSFTSAACTACGVCIDLCEPGALQRAGTPRMSDLAAETTVSLRAGALRRCQRCGAKFDGLPDVKHCPVCEWRRKHPFGARPTPLGARLNQT
jgi:formate hydrogenlyase subunit 6/NADH:ubiquinone oxidoreductase subunit I